MVLKLAKAIDEFVGEYLNPANLFVVVKVNV
jgi:hypothetical protein